MVVCVCVVRYAFLYFASVQCRMCSCWCYSMEEECSLSSCPASLVGRNMDVHGSLQRLAASFACTETYVTLLASQSTSAASWESGSEIVLYLTFPRSTVIIRWRGSATGRALDFAISRSRVQILLEAMLRNNLGEVVYTYVPLSPSSITWYRPKGGGALRLGR